MKKNFAIRLLFFPVAFSFLVSCEKAAPILAEAPKPVKVVKASLVRLADEVAGFGSLSYQKKVDLASPQDATVKELPYREGDIVRSGSVVARLVNPQLNLAVDRARNGVERGVSALSLADVKLREGKLSTEARILGIEKSRLEIAQAKAELAEAERKHADQETLFAAGGVPLEAIRSGRFALEGFRQRIMLMEKDIDIRVIGLRDEDLASAGLPVPGDSRERSRLVINLSVASLEAEREAALSSLEAAKKELESSTLALAELVMRSPVSATLGARHVEAGERVKREDKIVTMMDVTSLFAVVPVPESDAMRLGRGMEATVTVDSAGGEFRGIVDLVSPIADARSASFTVRVSLKDDKGRLKPGMFVRVKFLTGGAREFLVIPETCIAGKDEETATVFTVVRGLAAARKIRVGAAVSAGITVIEGLSEGEVLIDRPSADLKEGDGVAIQ